MGFPVVWVYWVISLTVVTYASAYIVKNFREIGFAALTAFYTIYLGASQILASRAINFDLGFYQFYAPAAVFIYPFIAQAIDMINEVYGRRSAHLAIVIAFITQVLLVTFIAMVNSLSPSALLRVRGSMAISIRAKYKDNGRKLDIFPNLFELRCICIL